MKKKVFIQNKQGDFSQELTYKIHKTQMWKSKKTRNANNKTNRFFFKKSILFFHANESNTTFYVKYA